MRRVLSALWRELAWTIVRPSRVLGIRDGRKRSMLLHSLFPGWMRERAWQRRGTQEFLLRNYPTYEDYIRRQRSKLEQVDLAAYDTSYPQLLGERLAAHRLVCPGMSVLCLAARLGSEVKAFLRLGCFAVGLDLNPGPNNRYVVYGDFHAVQFADATVDVVFTNSLDHALDVGRVITEVRRVLKPEGFFIVEAVRGTAEGVEPLSYESFFWSKLDDLIALIESHGFALVWRRLFAEPWPGEHLCLRRVDAGSSATTEELEPGRVTVSGSGAAGGRR